MAPKTPQANSKLPKPPTAGGPGPSAAIPAPANVLQRRTMSIPGTSSVSRVLKGMTPEQEALLAEALAIHSPGLIDLPRKPITTTPGSTQEVHNQGTVSSMGDGTSPTGLSPQSTFRAPPTQINRRFTSAATPSVSTQSLGSYSLSRPTSYTGMTPLSTSHHSLPSVASTPSPTTPGGTNRPLSGSPSGARTLLTSRLSAGPGALATPPGTRTSLMKQPLFQRPPGMAAPEGRSLSGIPVPPSLDNFEIGDRVIVESMALSGYLRFVGPTEFKTGTWAGIELDTPTGKNDGTVQDVTYFQCRPKHGIFVLAAKVAKSELLFAPSLDSAPQSPSGHEGTDSATSTINHAAQAASRITAGSRASRYIGMTASDLKQRNNLPPPSASRTSTQGLSNLSGASVRAASPTIRTLSGISGSPTAPRTSIPGSGGRSDSPSPVLKPHFRSASPTMRLAAGNRLSQSAIKPAPATLASKPVAHSRSTSSTSSVTSQSSAAGARARTSPTPRTLTSPRRLSSRSETPDVSAFISPSESRPNLLDQATTVQTSGSPFETSTEEIDTKSDGDETKSLLDKSMVSMAIDDALLQELEELRAMKATWEKEKAAKDQELKVVTDKMTQAWLDAARSQKEKTALIQEKTDLLEKLNSGASNTLLSQEQQSLIASLQKSLQEADEKALILDGQLQDLTVKAAEEEDRLNKLNEDNRVASEATIMELKAERDTLSTTVQEMEVQLKAVKEETLNVKAKLSENEAKLDSAELQVQESQTLLTKSEKQVRGLEDKMKELESLIAKRDQEISGLKLELQDIAGMVQSEEVDRMRKVWELEKKRLEDAVTDNITVITTLRSDIQAQEAVEEELLTKIKTLEISEKAAKEAAETFVQERSALEAKIAESEATLESRLSESQERMEELEAIALTVEEWRERCEAMQFEMIQKTAAVEDYGLKLADAQDQEDAIRQELEVIKKMLAESSAVDQAAALESSRAEVAHLEEEREQLLVKVSELEAALALSASTPRVSAPGSGDSEPVLDRAELEEEIAALKQMVHELTAENATVASDNKKLMQEHDILMEAHKHVETECLKLMDEVERLHAESLAVASMGESDGVDKNSMDMVHLKPDEKPRIGQEDLRAALDSVAVLSKDAAIVTSGEKQSGQSASVVRLENQLKEKQATLDKLTQVHALEMRDLRQRYVELDRTKTLEISQLHKELTDLESLIESKIFREADLEEEGQKKQKQIDRLQREISDLKDQLARLSGASGSAADLPPNGLPSKYSSVSSSNGATRAPLRERAKTTSDIIDKALYCEICDKEGHDIINCVATFGGAKPAGASEAPAFTDAQLDDDRMYCDNCEVFGQHYTDECPNESLTY
ncbi:CAP-Gly domain-containing linker protein 2 [Mortierella sp. NVP85]|nr:CAP-Gly domain-containing linker protein 2 [Mortierella sp. NVP85]